ncbi:MAG: nickel pincer cofactor biosynthesis protein LarC [Eubacteriales bacterium]|nr:nickel pincer cofactor biosynthesis protein LarC [Eubacteriales bacterium]
MENTLYLECYSGISGDMTVAALLDLGADRNVLQNTLKSLPLTGYRTEIKQVKKSGIEACDFHVILDKEYENHDHDMGYLHGHEHYEEGSHGHEHGGEMEYVYEHEKHSHHHIHRGIKEIKEIIHAGSLTENAERLAVKIFTILAEAEAKAHNVPAEEVHFHEVGAVDSIVDIVAVAVCMDNLKITEVIIPELWEGKGTVRCQHGILPVPVPAVLNVAAQNGLKIKITEVQGELVTPTGAAIAAAIRTKERLPEHFSVRKTGIGAGKRQYECPGILRAMLITEKEAEKEDTICKLEANIDDCTGEALGYTMKCLMETGAKDVYYVPAFMKKNRPAWILNVLCKEEDREKLEQIIFRETTTIGIRRTEMKRTILEREIKRIGTNLGEVLVKVCRDREKIYFYPEYESLTEFCKKTGLSYQEAYEIAVNEAEKEV